MRRLWFPGDPSRVGSPDHFWADPEKHPGDTLAAWLTAYQGGRMILPAVAVVIPTPNKVIDLASPDGGHSFNWTGAFRNGATLTGIADLIAIAEWTDPIITEGDWAAAIASGWGTALYGPGGYIDASSYGPAGTGASIFWDPLEQGPIGDPAFVALRYKNTGGAPGPISNFVNYDVSP